MRKLAWLWSICNMSRSFFISHFYHVIMANGLFSDLPFLVNNPNNPTFRISAPPPPKKIKIRKTHSYHSPVKKKIDLQNTLFCVAKARKEFKVCFLPMYCKVPQIVPVRSLGFINFARPKSTSFMCPKVTNSEEIFLSWHSLDRRQRQRYCSRKINLPIPQMSKDLQENLRSSKIHFAKVLFQFTERLGGQSGIVYDSRPNV